MHKNWKITFRVGVIFEAEQTSAGITSVVVSIRRADSAFDRGQPVGHTGSALEVFGLIPCYIRSSAPQPLPGAYTGQRVEKAII